VERTLSALRCSTVTNGRSYVTYVENMEPLWGALE